MVGKRGGDVGGRNGGGKERKEKENDEDEGERIRKRMKMKEREEGGSRGVAGMRRNFFHLK